MSILRITKRFHFEMAHALYAYDGICRNIHGHSYQLEVTITGSVLKASGQPKDGMVMDFHDLKTIVKQAVVDRLDHAIMVNSLVDKEQKNALSELTSRMIVVDFQPTTENILLHIAQILSPQLTSNLKLYSLKLFETGTSFAEWFASDNP